MLVDFWPDFLARCFFLGIVVLGAVGLAVVRKPHDVDGTEAEVVTERGPVRAILRDLPMSP